MTASAIDLCTIADVKQYLGETGSALDGELQTLVTAISRAFSTFAGVPFAAATYTNEVYNGTGGQVLMLRAYPITAVSAVNVCGFAYNLTTDERTAGFQFDDKALYLTGGAFFPMIQRSVKVTYTAGYALPGSAPEDLKEACVEAVADRLKRRANIGIVARQIAGETISYGAIDIPKSAKMVLNLYQRAAPV